MAYTIRKDYVPSSKYGVKCPYSMTPKYITIHNTANDASAKNEVSYMKGNNNQVSYHVAIDDKEAVIAIPFNRNAWHTGDSGGANSGNRTSIGIEICYSKSGGAKYTQAEENAVQYTAQLLHDYGWGIERVKKHQDWSGKYCPHRILAEGRWKEFLNRVQKALDKLNGKGDELTMSQYKELLAKIEQLEKQLDDKLSKVDERKVSKSHEKHFEWAKENGLTDGSNPQNYLTREQAFTVLSRYNEKFGNK